MCSIIWLVLFFKICPKHVSSFTSRGPNANLDFVKKHSHCGSVGRRLQIHRFSEHAPHTHESLSPLCCLCLMKFRRVKCLELKARIGIVQHRDNTAIHVHPRFWLYFAPKYVKYNIRHRRCQARRRAKSMEERSSFRKISALPFLLAMVLSRALLTL